MKSLVALPDALSTDVGCFAKMVSEFTFPEELHQNFSLKNESPFCLVGLTKTLMYVPSWISKSQMKDWICYTPYALIFSQKVIQSLMYVFQIRFRRWQREHDVDKLRCN